MSSASPPPSSPSPDSDSALQDDEINFLSELTASEQSDRSSDILDRPSPDFDSEADAQHDWDPESALESPESGSQSPESDTPSPFRDLSANPFLARPDSYPLSPDLEGELELALLAEMDPLPPLPDHRAHRVGNREGSMAAQRQGGAAIGDSPGPDVLVDLELYFRQDRNQRRPQNQQGPADVIDLTNEPDSPVQTHAPRPSVNPRRENSRRSHHPGHLPSFARSDSSILAGNAPVIDLTDDSPEMPRRRRPVPPPPPPPPRHRRDAGAFMLHNPASAFSGLAAGLRRHLYPFRLYPAPDEDVQLLGILHNRINPADLNNPLGNIQLQYEHGAFDQRAESPKPVHQAPPPAKPGFTRDTGSDLVVICPACNEELAYDPDVPATESHPTRKGKRHRSEHHFWALKACGHVYCEDCFENRRPAAKRHNTGFPRDAESKIVCAVDGCDSQATNKTAWVGIFL